MVQPENRDSPFSRHTHRPGNNQLLELLPFAQPRCKMHPHTILSCQDHDGHTKTPGGQSWRKPSSMATLRIWGKKGKKQTTTTKKKNAHTHTKYIYIYIYIGPCKSRKEPLARWGTSASRRGRRGFAATGPGRPAQPIPDAGEVQAGQTGGLERDLMGWSKMRVSQPIS